mgnify:CR=1 FL=1
MDDIESVIYIAREVSGPYTHLFDNLVVLTSWAVYKIPPLNKNEGYRANDWGDLAAPLWKGRLRILENSKGATLVFEDSNTGTRHDDPCSRNQAD